MKLKWKSFVGKDAYEKLEEEIESDIGRITNPDLYEGDETKPSLLNSGQIIQSNSIISPNVNTNTSDNKTNNTLNTPSTTTTANKSGFKKIKIVEEEIDEEKIKLEDKKVNDFFERIGEARKESKELIKEEKLKEACDVNRKLLAECTNFLPEVGKDSHHFSKLENIINEINSEINDFSKKDVLVRNICV